MEDEEETNGGSDKEDNEDCGGVTIKKEAMWCLYDLNCNTGSGCGNRRIARCAVLQDAC